MSNHLNAVCFYNDGTFDKRSFTMLGLSAKSSDDSIGFFGTGFKYAIATLLRNGLSVRIVTRSTVYNFRTEAATFRDKDYTSIFCDLGEEMGDYIELPFTTHLGANWKLWQAYRELYTNAKDEGGGVCLTDFDGSDCAGAGDVCVLVGGDNVKSFIDVYHKHDKYFLNENIDAICVGDRMRVVRRKSDSDNVVYYRTMYTGTKLDKESLFTYDYTAKQELTEDRTLAFPWMLREHIGDLWANDMSYDLLIENLPKVAKSDVFEYNLETSYRGPSEQFTRACAYLTEHHMSMPMWARDLYTKQLPFDQQVIIYTPTRHQSALLKRAIRVMHHHRCMVDIERLVLCVSLPDETLGYYAEGIIYISKQVFDMGFEKLLGTIYEEYIHQHDGAHDNSRKMQNILVDRVASLMLEVYDIETIDD